jgi:RNA polymerase sigma-70 factor (ECF subfamily)
MTGAGPTDRAMVERFLRTRDEETFRALYRRHTPALHALALRLLAHRAADAEDAVQDMWIRGIGRLDGFRWEASLRTWLGSIVVNCCRERLRAGWRWVQEDEPQAPDRPDGEPPVDLTLDVDRALGQLPAGSRAVFVLHDIEGRTHDEIGTLLGIAAGTSRSQLFHARRQLRALLQ